MWAKPSLGEWRPGNPTQYLPSHLFRSTKILFLPWPLLISFLDKDLLERLVVLSSTNFIEIGAKNVTITIHGLISQCLVIGFVVVLCFVSPTTS